MTMRALVAYVRALIGFDARLLDWHGEVRRGSIAPISIISQHVHSSGNTGSQAAAWAAVPRR